MEKMYIYQKHDWEHEFYVSRKLKTREECYCEICDAYDELMAEYDDEEAFDQKLRELFDSGWDIVLCDDYDDIREKYHLSEAQLPSDESNDHIAAF